MFCANAVACRLFSTQAVYAGELLAVIDPTFSNVVVDCASRYVYQASPGGTCAGPNVPQQDLNGAPRIGWT
jgi:hypothetical protein